jgi:hypothetical protein
MVYWITGLLFHFEIFLWKLKRQIRGANKPLEQAVNRLKEGALDCKPVNSQVSYSTMYPNNFCLIAHNFALEITHIYPSGLLDGFIWILEVDLYDFPCNSSLFSIGWYMKTDFASNLQPLNKCIPLSAENEGRVLLIPYVQ